MFLGDEEEMKKSGGPKEYTDEEIENMSLEDAKKLYNNTWNVPHNKKLRSQLQAKLSKKTFETLFLENKGEMDTLTNSFLKLMRDRHSDIMNKKDPEALKTTLAGYAQLINPEAFFDIITRDWK